ncbi:MULTISPECIES: Hpt domain-containing protein [Achromobacter]|uniref:Hpt domain-containing protein n=1 Tax=Achromobacter spanius TaxID=217203 RepID=A0ABY8H0I2_9BURK|nr:MULTISPECIES: Hpt domain-containing protein [Achromobacter]WAI85813.1 Hpt domain-containing protein [Achromobacter spanius]WEX95894.1 Hpt domain-containing protein [Achromobacter sp. SS2-2022]WFP10385.1 Hpt domain-containing protein [Achromobacter spanius]
MKKKDRDETAYCAPSRSAFLSDDEAPALAALNTPTLRHEHRTRTVTELTGADPARIRTLANAFIQANDLDLQRLRLLHARDDRAALRHLAHRIKGAAQMTGDTQLSRLCSVLSGACMNPDDHDLSLDAIVAQLDLALQEFADSCQQMADDVISR